MSVISGVLNNLTKIREDMEEVLDEQYIQYLACESEQERKDKIYQSMAGFIKEESIKYHLSESDVLGIALHIVKDKLTVINQTHKAIRECERKNNKEVQYEESTNS